jgi:hypothetical protein
VSSVTLWLKRHSAPPRAKPRVILTRKLRVLPGNGVASRLG